MQDKTGFGRLFQNSVTIEFARQSSKSWENPMGELLVYRRHGLAPSHNGPAAAGTMVLPEEEKKARREVLVDGPILVTVAEDTPEETPSTK